MSVEIAREDAYEAGFVHGNDLCAGQVAFWKQEARYWQDRCVVADAALQEIAALDDDVDEWWGAAKRIALRALGGIHKPAEGSKKTQ